jgi:hypothetical protein
MPISIEVTCDICGEAAEEFSSFFTLLRDERMPWNPPEIPKVDMHGADHAIRLCPEHFEGLTVACEHWLAGVT